MGCSWDWCFLHLQVTCIAHVVGRLVILVVLTVRDQANQKDHLFDPYQNGTRTEHEGFTKCAHYAKPHLGQDQIRVPPVGALQGAKHLR